jgi:hypothetical protein
LEENLTKIKGKKAKPREILLLDTLILDVLFPEL